jgi:hypothetical protein
MTQESLAKARPESIKRAAEKLQEQSKDTSKPATERSKALADMRKLTSDYVNLGQNQQLKGAVDEGTTSELLRTSGGTITTSKTGDVSVTF